MCPCGMRKRRHHRAKWNIIEEIAQPKSSVILLFKRDACVTSCYVAIIAGQHNITKCGHVGRKGNSLLSTNTLTSVHVDIFCFARLPRTEQDSSCSGAEATIRCNLFPQPRQQTKDATATVACSSECKKVQN